jgi:acetylornithine deacetylase/succinyl-diaminopimelate desuccinylase-like protein
MIIDCRTMPSTDILRLENRIQDIVQQIIDRRNSEINTIIDGRKSNTKKDKLHATVTNKNNLPAVVIPQGRDHPLARACVGALTKNGHSAESIKIQACGPANESYMLMTKDIPTICGFGPVGGNPHGADEFVEISSLAETVQIYQQVVIDYIKNLQCK